MTLRDIVPSVLWVPKYTKDYISDDIISGLTMSTFVIPQAMAYAVVANLPPVWGLYSTVIPFLVHFLIGTSEFISNGPFAVTSLIIGQALSSSGDWMSRYLHEYERLDIKPKDLYISISNLITFCVASGLFVLYATRGYKRLAPYLPDSLISAFTVGATIHIILSQLKFMLGVSLRPVDGTFLAFKTLWSIILSIPRTNLMTLLLTLLSAAIYTLLSYLEAPLAHWLIRIKTRRTGIEQISTRLFYPKPFFVIILATVVSMLFGMPDYGVAIVGKVPSGLPEIHNPWKVVFEYDLRITLRLMVQIMPFVLSLILVSYVTILSVLKTFPDEMGKLIYEQELKISQDHATSKQTGQEILSLAVSAFIGSTTSCFVPCGSLSRSAILQQTKSRTPASGVFACLIILVVLFLLTRAVEDIPMPALSTMIVLALAPTVKKLSEGQKLYREARYPRTDQELSRLVRDPEQNIQRSNQAQELPQHSLEIWKHFIIWTSTLTGVIVFDPNLGIIGGMLTTGIIQLIITKRLL
ncbi:sulfate transporter family-domain-containing protein [Gorgonomyces haynaldii]|nr:sulfate transporter family-domain-containing protein [Gorgonomyces haynaldii]